MNKKKINLEITESNEIKLIIYCSRVKINADLEKKIVALLCLDIDWNYIIKIATKHGVLPLIYRRISSIKIEINLGEGYQKLREYSYHIVLRNTQYLKELLNIVDLFDQNGIQSIVFKGPVLSSEVYGDLGLRVFSDLDILVQKDNFLNACNVLTSHGYKPCWAWNLLNKNLELNLLQSKDEYAFKNNFINVDLHQILTAQHFLSSQFLFENLWENTKLVSISHHKFSCLGNEDLFLYLCVHGSKECWRKLKWICDINEFLSSHPDLNWDNLILRAQKMGCQRILLLSLQISHKFLDTDLPPTIHAKINDDLECKNLAHEFYQRLFWENNSLSNRLTLEKILIHMRMLDKLEDKLACLWDLRRLISSYFIQIFPNQKDHDFVQLPKKLYFLYYLIRPLRIFLKVVTIKRKIY